MYWDLIIIAAIIIIVVCCFRRFSSFVYVVGIIDIFLRLVDFLAKNIGAPEITALVNRIGFPASIPAIIYKYTDSLFSTILMWCFFGIMVVFEFYVVRTFWKKKK